MPFARRRIRRVTGLEHIPRSGPMIVIANHVSWVDPILLASVLRERTTQMVRFVAASGKYRALGGLPIRRDNPGAVLIEALQFLKRGWPIGIFPNGNVPRNGEQAVIRTGAARLALWSDAPVIPIAIRGIAAHSLIRSIWQLCTARRLELVIGPPLIFPTQPVDQIPRDYLQWAALQMVESIRQLVDPTS